MSVEKSNDLACPEQDKMDHKKEERAKKRWMLLINALVKNKSPIDENSDISVRRFASFGLFESTGFDVDKEEGKCHRWYRYTCKHCNGYKANIRILDGTFDVKDILGFNNTGNVCIWPAEEILTYYCLKNIDMFKNKAVCELGGGMTCLAGISIGVHGQASHVLLSDGNNKSVENVDAIISKNEEGLGNTKAEARVLLWNEHNKMSDLENTFDTIIAADCLFFDGCREDLSRMIFKLLKTEGIAILFAPTRGTTFEEFLTIAECHFEVERQDNYDPLIWSLHKDVLSKGKEVYDPDLHYPLMLKLHKKL